MNRRWQGWAPAVVATAVVGAGALVSTAQADAKVDLPDKSPQQVVAMVAGSDVQAFSGVLQQQSHLGLPQVSGEGPTADTPVAYALDLLTAPHTVRVYADGPAQARVQVLDRYGERDVVRNGTDVWLYSSSENKAVHMTLPADADHDRSAEAAAALTPQQLAEKALAAVDNSTKVSVGTDTKIAGRDAYQLLVQPRDNGTTVDRVTIGVDAATGLPLSASVSARGQTEPAFSVAFTELTVGRPDAARFSFTPPAGATVRQQAVPSETQMKAWRMEARAEAQKHSMAAGHENMAQEHMAPVVTGDGWDAVVELPLNDAKNMPQMLKQLQASPLFKQMATTVASGHLLHSSLVNVLLTNDGRVLLGAVPADRLQAVAAS